LVRQEPFVHGLKALEKHRFRPMYAEANMGHPSRTKDRGYEMKSAGLPLQSNLDPHLGNRHLKDAN
jgi:hypothetical protein